MLINNVQGAYLATSHLIKKTRKQPGYLKSSYAIGNFAERNSGFFKAVRAYGHVLIQKYRSCAYASIDGAYADMKEILNRRGKVSPHAISPTMT